MRWHIVMFKNELLVHAANAREWILEAHHNGPLPEI